MDPDTLLADTLLAELDPLPYAARVAHAARTGVRLRGDARLRPLLAALAAGDPYRREVGLTVAVAARDTDHLVAALDDENPAVQARAVAFAAREPGVPDAALAARYDDAPAALRGVLVRAVRRSGRSVLAAGLVEVAARRWGDAEAARLLLACRGADLTSRLASLAHVLDAGAWRRLGAYEPVAVLDHAEAVLSALPDGPARNRWWEVAGWGVRSATADQPARALALIERRLPADRLPAAVRDALGRLADVGPRAVARLLLAPARHRALARAGLAPGLLRRAGRFTDDELAAFGRVLWATPAALARLLDALPPSRRGRIFDAVTASLDLTAVVLPDVLLDVLPHADRHRQARRMLGLRAVRDHTRETWRVTALLPAGEAYAALEPDVRRTDAEERAIVLAATVLAAGRSRDPEAVATVLRAVAPRLRNEQDPVRGTVLDAVAGLPPSLLRADHVAALDRLAGDALDARDLSWRSLDALDRLVRRALRRGAVHDEPALVTWALTTDERLVARTGRAPGYHGLCDGLPHGLEHRLYAAVRPHVDAAASRGSYGLALRLASAFGRRGHAIDPLQDVLEGVAGAGDPATVEEAAAALLRVPARRDARVEALLARDLGLAGVPAVWDVLVRRRTDLLDRILADPGRGLERAGPDPAASGPRVWWWLAPATVHRWLPRQQTAYSDLVARVAGDEGRPLAVRAVAVESLGRMPGGGRARVARYLDDPSVPLREAALDALARTDRPGEVVGDLLDRAGGDDARVAVYAATRAARYVRPSDLGSLLGPVLTGPDARVTARKEAARLLATLRADGAGSLLVAAWPDAHRDVRAAIVSALVGALLDDPAVWAVVEAAPDDDAPVAHVVAATPPFTVAVRHRERFGALVVRICGHRDRDVAAAALLALRTWAPWVPDAAALCATAVADLDRPYDVWFQAVHTLVELARDGRAGDRVETLAVGLLAADRRAPEVSAERDRPARRRLHLLVGTVAVPAPRRAAAARDLARRTAAALEATGAAGLLLRDLVRLDLAALDLAALDLTAIGSGRPAAGLDRLAARLAGRPVTAVYAARELERLLDRNQRYWDSADLEGPADRLAAAGEVTSGLLALTLVGRCGRRTHWPPPWRDRLLALREHPDPEVREAATEVTVTPT